MSKTISLQRPSTAHMARAMDFPHTKKINASAHFHKTPARVTPLGSTHAVTAGHPNLLIRLFNAIWNALFGSFSNALTLKTVKEFSFHPRSAPANLKNERKQFVYDELMKGRDFQKTLHFSKHSFTNSSAVQALSLFKGPKVAVTMRAGGFAYDQSTATKMHWTANFADSLLFGFCQGPLMAQDEEQVAMHPALAHLRTHLANKWTQKLGDNEIALITNVERMGKLKSNGLYGNAFAQASAPRIKATLQTLSPAPTSNIFAFAAPSISWYLKGKPYGKHHLNELFTRAFLAFKAIKETHGKDKQIVIHTGNWGAGAFGNDPKTVAIIQLAAARLAGVQINYYPMDSVRAFKEASRLLDSIASKHGEFNVGNFLDHLADNAVVYGLRYGASNGT